MRIRKSTVLIFTASIIILYTLWMKWFPQEAPAEMHADLETLCASTNDQHDSPDTNSPPCQFLAKIKSLEVELEGNKKALHKLYDTMNELIKLGQNDKHSNYSSVLADLETFHRDLISSSDTQKNIPKDISPNPAKIRVQVPDGSCPNGAAPASIDMAEVYETLPFDNPDGGAWKQGFPIKYNEERWSKEKLQVFVVPHSHQDPGWVKTFDEYFTQQTSRSLSNMLTFLTNNPKMRFIYAEMAFFHRWYEGLTDEQKAQVKTLLKENRFEIVSGGWVMTDEANSHYYATLAEMTAGHQWLKDNLDYQPRVSWSIDPFGHSSTMPYLWRHMGFRYMLIQRTHYSVKKHLAKDTNLEFIWRQRWDMNGTHDIFCHMMPFYSYDVPHTCGPEPAICCQFDFMRGHSKYSCPWGVNPTTITANNVEERAKTLLQQYRKKATLYRNNVVLIPLGDDFRYDTEQEWTLQYENYQKIFDYLNSHEELHVEAKFATLSEYFMALESRAGTSSSMENSHSAPQLPKGYPSLVGDMFTYADRDDHYWSGYFTSRPYHKRLDRLLEDKLRQAEMLFTFATLFNAKFGTDTFPVLKVHSDLEKARRWLSLFQHHDGITGTAKKYVMNDYKQKLEAALQFAHSSIEESLHFLTVASTKRRLAQQDQEVSSSFQLIDLSDNVRDYLKDKPSAQLHLEQGSSHVVYVFNTLAHTRSGLVSMWVSHHQGLTLYNSGNQRIPYDVFPYVQPGSSPGNQGYLIHFWVADVAPLGLEMVTVSMLSTDSSSKEGEKLLGTMTYFNEKASEVTVAFGEFAPELGVGDSFVVENALMQLHFNAATGMLQSVKNKVSGEIQRLEVSFKKYGARNSRERSGAYLFLPDGPPTTIHTASPRIRILKGARIQEVVVHMDHVEHHVRLVDNSGVESESIEMWNYVDLSTTDDNEELVMQLTSDIHNQDQYFYTDLNCFQFLRRRHFKKLPLQANVYPMPCGAFIENDKEGQNRLTILAAQPQGVAVPEVGVVQVWLDRRLQQDDNRGLEEPVTDNRPWTPNKVRILLETLTTAKYSGNPPKLGHLTGTAVATLRTLLHPTQAWKLTTSANKGGLMKNVNFLTGKGLPCDYHLVNLRTQVSSKDGTTSLENLRPVLTWHRQAACGEVWLRGVDCLFDPEVAYKSLFNDLVVNRVSRVSFTHQINLNPGSTYDRKTVSTPPMELDAFELHFQ